MAFVKIAEDETFTVNGIINGNGTIIVSTGSTLARDSFSDVTAPGHPNSLLLNTGVNVIVGVKQISEKVIYNSYPQSVQ